MNYLLLFSLAFGFLFISFVTPIYGIWIPESPEKLYEKSQMILVGNITNVNPINFDESSVSIINENGTDVPVIENYTLTLDQYTVNVEQFLKGNDGSDSISVLQPTTSVPGRIVPIIGFSLGDHVLLYIEKNDDQKTYSPESFKIPQSCDAKSVLEEPRIQLGSSFLITQDGVEKHDNFTAGIPIKFSYNVDTRTLEGKEYLIDTSINRIVGNDMESVFAQKIHASSEPCTWIASATWEVTPKEGKHTMSLSVHEKGKDDGDSGYSHFFVERNYKLSPLKQFNSGIPVEKIQCNESLVLLQKHDGSPACVKPATKQKLIERGWAINQSDETVTIGEGQREGSLLVQKIRSDSIEGLNFPEYPVATNVGYPITLHIGDKASNGCTVDLTLININDNTATFLKTEHQNRPCPICLSENTAIDTPNGPVNIKELRDGMAVLTQDSFGNKQTATILKTGKTMVFSDHKMIRVILDDKRELYASPNHPTSDGRLFGNLSVGDILDGSEIKSLEQVQYNGTYTYDILPSGQTGTYWANGILVKSTLK